MRALVTGATGFVGQHLIDALLQAGWGVRALVRDPARVGPLAGRGVELWRGDLDDPASLRSAADGLDVVFHLAAQLHAPGVPHTAYERNVAGTRNLVDAIAGAGIRRLVAASSVAAIGIRNLHRIDETVPCRPDRPYGVSKLAVDGLLVDEARRRGLPAVIVRPPTVYGPGERHNFFTLCRAIATRRFLLIGAAENRIDFCWIGNLVRALVAAAERGRPGELYNVADEPVLPFRETCATLAALLGTRLWRVHLPTPLAYAAAVPLGLLGRATGRPVPLDPGRVRTMTSDMCFDLAKARAELGYRAEGTFAEHAARTIAWYRREGLLR